MNDVGSHSLAQRPVLSCTAQFIARYARLTPQAIAIVEAGVHVSYAELAADLLRYVRALERIAVRPGMLVGVETMNRYLHTQLLLACEVIGAKSISLTAGTCRPTTNCRAIATCCSPGRRRRSTSMRRRWS